MGTACGSFLWPLSSHNLQTEPSQFWTLFSRLKTTSEGSFAISSGWFQHMVRHGNSSVLNVHDTVAGSCRARIVSVTLGFAVLCHSLHGLALSITVPLLPFSFSLWPPRRAESSLPLWLSFSNGNVHSPCPVARSGAVFPKERTEGALSHHTFGGVGGLCPRRQFR